MFDIQISRIQDLQRKYTQMVLATRPESGLGRVVKRILIRTHRAAVKVTHVDTGALRASHIMDLALRAREIVGTVYISRDTVNPKHGERPYKYGITEHERGGSHAFYERTFYTETLEAARDALKQLSADADAPFRGP